jgi:two-component system NarL family response regulator
MTENKPRILIVARPGPLREGVEALLTSVPQIEIIGTAPRTSRAIEIIGEQSVNVLLLEAGLPRNGASRLVAFCRRKRPGLRCLVLADTMDQVREARAFGADAVFLKGFPADRFVRTMERLLSDYVKGCC